MNRKMAVRNKLFAWLLVLVMTLSMTPSDVLATEGNDAVTVTDGAEEVLIDSNCTGNEEEISENVRSLQEQINALPTGEEYRNMSADEQDAVYELAASVSDAYIELSEEDQAKLDITRLEELFAVMNEGVAVFSEGTVNYESIEINPSSLNGNAIRGVSEGVSVSAMDNWGYFYSEKHASSGGLPNSGQLTMGNGVPYSLAVGENANAYDGSDCIRLTANDTSRTMDLQTLGVYQKIFVLATAGGPGTGHYADFKVTLNYTDGSYTATTYKLYDWFDTTNVANVEKYYAIQRMQCGTATVDGNTSGGPVLHSAAIEVDSTKLLKQITFTMNGKDGDASNMSGLYCCIFAVTGATPVGVPAAPVATASTKTEGDTSGAFIANWNTVEGATGYRLDVARDRKFTDILSDYNNKDVGNATSVVVSGNNINADKTYYYRVRAVNDKGQSLSSNRISTDLPIWLKKALADTDYGNVEYNAEENKITFKQDVQLKDTLVLPTDEATTIELSGKQITAPEGKSAISAGSGKDVELFISNSGGEGNGGIAGNGTDANGNGASVIDFSIATGNTKIELKQTTITGSDGKNASSADSNGGNGGAGISAGSGIQISVGTGSKVIGGKGGNANNGAGGNGGAGISGGTATVSSGGNVTGGNGGNSASKPGTGGAAGVTGTGGTNGQAGVKHVHAWVYSASGTSIVAYCNNQTNAASCSCQGEQNAVSISLETQNVVYTGTSVLALTSLTEGSSAWTNAGLSFPNLSYEGIEDTTYAASSTAPTDVGSYQVTMTAGEKSVYSTFKVLPKSLNASDIAITLTPDSFEYSLFAHSPEITVKDTTRNATLANDTDYSLSGELSGTDINSYTITVTGKGNYKDSVNKTWKITKKLPDITELPTAAAITYGDKLSASTLTGGKAKRGETEILGTFQWKDSAIKPAVADSGVKEYEVVFYPTDTEEYEPVTCNVKLMVTPKIVQLLWSNTSLTYNGTNQIPKAVVSNLEDADKEKVTVVVNGEQVNTNTNAGYSATASSLAGDSAANYKLSDTATDNQTKYKIYPKKLTAAMVNATTSYVYNGATITPEISVKDGTNTLSAGSDYTLSGDTSGKDAKNDYKLTVTGTGNYSGSVNVVWKITDAYSPTGTIKVSTHEWNTLINTLTFGIFYKERQTVTITAADEGSGVDEVSYFITSSDTLMNQETLAALPKSKWKSITNGGSFTINPDNKFVIYAKITDKSGNVTYISSDGIILDKTAPVITGIQNNKTYCSDVFFTVSDTIGLKFVKVDNADAVLQSNGSYKIAATGEKASHTIVAEDLAGNNTTCTITINANGGHHFGEWVVTTPATCEEDGVQSHTCSACGLVETQPIEKIEHQYKTGNGDAHFVWTVKTEDGIVTGYNATVYFECKNDPSHILDAGSCDVTREETVKPTQNTVGDTYRASITYDDVTYTAQRTTTLAKLEKLDSKDSSKSNIYTSTSVADTAPATKLGSELNANLAKELLTEAEKADYESSNVSTDVTVYLEVQNINDGVVSGDALKVEAQIADLATEKANTTSDVEVKTGAAYLDLSMYKNVKTEEMDGSNNVISKSDTTTQITDTGEDITITMDIPTGIPTVAAGFTRTYHVIRVHDDNAEVLDTTQNGNQLTFKTSKFSTYAVSYVDVKDVSVNSPVESSGSGSMGIPVTKITISSEKSSLTQKGDTLQLTVDITPSNATDKKIKWSSSDPSIATVDENGKVTAVGNGTVTITAKTTNGKTATFTIVVDLEIEKEEEKSEDADNETNVTLDTTFHKLPLAEAKATKNAVKVSWKKVTGADGYVLYGAPCNTKGKINKMKKLAVIKNGSQITYTDRKLKSGIYYKYCVKAYKLVNGKKVWLAKSKTIHVTTAGGKYGNARAVKVSNTKVILKKGKSLVIKAQQIAENKPIKQHTDIKFESTNTKIATVTKNGRIKAKKKGTCYIYVYAQNGTCKRIKVIVS